jgi:hypothetical protein
MSLYSVAFRALLIAPNVIVCVLLILLFAFIGGIGAVVCDIARFIMNQCKRIAINSLTWAKGEHASKRPDARR